MEQGPSEEVGRNVKITTIPGVTTYSVAAKQGDMNSGYEDFDYHWAGLPSRETYPGIPLGTRMMVSGTRMATGSKTETFLADAITQLK